MNDETIQQAHMSKVQLNELYTQQSLIEQSSNLNSKQIKRSIHFKYIITFVLIMIMLLTNIYLTINDKEIQIVLTQTNQFNISIEDKKKPIKMKQFQTNLSDNQKQKNYIVIHMQLTLQQNIPFLRQWLIYHISIGIEKFYIYDNGSSNKWAFISALSGEQKTPNKYGYQYRQNLDQIVKEWNTLKEDFKQYLIIKQWISNNGNNKNKVLTSEQAYIDYLKTYGNQSIYTLFLDVDEFLFSPDSFNLKQTIKLYEKINFGKITFKQKKFIDRLCNQKKKVTQIYDTIDSHQQILGKNLIKNIHVIKQLTSMNPYVIQVQNNLQNIIMNQNIWRINHYDVTYKNMYSLRQIKTEAFNVLQKSYDNSMNRFKQFLNQKCQNKCSDTYIYVKHKYNKDRQSICNYPKYKLIKKQQYNLFKLNYLRTISQNKQRLNQNTSLKKNINKQKQKPQKDKQENQNKQTRAEHRIESPSKIINNDIKGKQKENLSKTS